MVRISTSEIDTTGIKSRLRVISKLIVFKIKIVHSVIHRVTRCVSLSVFYDSIQCVKLYRETFSSKRNVWYYQDCY